MADHDRIKRAEINLDRQLDWIERIQKRSQAILVVHISILTIFVTAHLAFDRPLVVNWADSGDLNREIFFAITLLLAVIPFFRIISIFYPKLKNGIKRTKSLIFFDSIGRMKQSEFIEQSTNLDDKAYLLDLLDQIWINSRIATKKIRSLRVTYSWLIASWLSVILLYCELVFGISEFVDKLSK